MLCDTALLDACSELRVIDVSEILESASCFYGTRHRNVFTVTLMERVGGGQWTYVSVRAQLQLLLRHFGRRAAVQRAVARVFKDVEESWNVDSWYAGSYPDGLVELVSLVC